MRSRLRGLGVPGAQSRTSPAAALRQLSFLWPRVTGGGVPRLVEYKANLVSEAASRLGIDVDRLTVRDLAGEVEWAKVSFAATCAYSSAPTRLTFAHSTSPCVTSPGRRRWRR